MTVSRALRNSPEVSKTTRERILRIAEELGYRPNPLVSVWMARVAEGRSRAFAPSLAYLASYKEAAERQGMLRSRLLDSARSRAEEAGFRLEEHSLFLSGMTPHRLSSILDTRACPGLLVAPLPCITQEIDIQWERFSAVAIGYSLRSPELHRVVVNHFMGMTIALEELVKLGRRRIGIVLKELADDRTNHHWTSAYLGFLWHHAGISPLPLFVQPSLEKRAFAEWFRANKPDAVIGTDGEVVDWIDALDRRKHPKKCVFVHLHEEYSDRKNIYAVVTSSAKEVASAGIDALIGLIKRNERGIPPVPRLTLVPCEFHVLKA